MKNNIVPVEVAQKVFSDSNLPCIGKAGIREINKLARDLEAASGVKFIHMEMGNPGLPAAQAGIEAQIKALQEGVAATYPPIDGVPAVKMRLLVSSRISSTLMWMLQTAFLQ